jgi:hypothetical protein
MSVFLIIKIGEKLRFVRHVFFMKKTPFKMQFKTRFKVRFLKPGILDKKFSFTGHPERI